MRLHTKYQRTIRHVTGIRASSYLLQHGVSAERGCAGGGGSACGAYRREPRGALIARAMAMVRCQCEQQPTQYAIATRRIPCHREVRRRGQRWRRREHRVAKKRHTRNLMGGGVVNDGGFRAAGPQRTSSDDRWCGDVRRRWVGGGGRLRGRKMEGKAAGHHSRQCRTVRCDRRCRRRRRGRRFECHLAAGIHVLQQRLQHGYA
jgi:hypothetical protein